MDLQGNVGQKRSNQHISDIAEQDCKRVCNPDLTRAFTNLDDAVDRLLPFHVSPRLIYSQFFNWAVASR